MLLARSWPCCFQLSVVNDYGEDEDFIRKLHISNAHSPTAHAQLFSECFELKFSAGFLTRSKMYHEQWY